MVEDTTPAELSRFRYKILTRLAHAIYPFIQGMTMGVRAACFDEQGRIFLVKHSYIPGWHMPGGGVARGETVRQALAKELREEGNLEAIAPPELLHVYYNKRTSKRDHVVFFRCLVRQTGQRAKDWEIVDSGFFPLDALPPDVTSATRRRLRELAGEAPFDELW